MGRQPPMGGSRAKPDPGYLKDYERFKDVSEFQKSSYYKDVLEEDDSLDHKSTRTDLLESANSGCHLCGWLLNSLDSRSRMSNSRTQTRYRRRPAVVQKDPWMSPLGMRCIGHYYISVRCAPDQRNWPVTLQKAGLDTHRHAYQDYVGDEQASLIVDSLRAVSKESPGFISAMASADDQSPSTSTWSLFEYWLDACTSNHPECRSQTARHTEEIVPTRLLDVRDSELVRLVQSSSWSGVAKTPRYAALSHCWGNTHEPQLNTGTLDSLKRGVLLTNLPRTFKDAITVAKRLEIPYVWIDSLCILQDSTEDWLKESSKMGSIYRNSYLCIAATAGKDNNSGFLDKRDLTHKRPFVYHNLVIQEDVAMSNDNFNMRQITWCDRIRTLVEWGVERGPLNQRAWVFQERMLAPRTIHCTSDEFVWECCTGMRSETHPLLTSGGSVVKDAWRQLLRVPQSLRDPLSQELPLKQRKAFLERWSELVATYSKAQLTHLDDKLIACSAITKEFQPILGNYAAGLWKAYMPSQLLWSHHTFCGVGHKTKHNMRPRGKPSWSWASLDCRVQLPYYYDAARDRNFNTKDDHSLEEPIDLSTSALVDVLDVNVILRGEDPTGLVDGGSIRLGGCQLYSIYRSAAFGYRLDTEAPDAFERGWGVRWSWDDPDDPMSAAEDQIKKDAWKPDNAEEEMIMKYDGPKRYILAHKKLLAHHAPTLTQMCCLPIRTGKNGTIAGLILEFTGEATGQYRRVGYFRCEKKYIDRAPKVQPALAFTPPYEWPSAEKFSPEDGYTICIV